MAKSKPDPFFNVSTKGGRLKVKLYKRTVYVKKILKDKTKKTYESTPDEYFAGFQWREDERDKKKRVVLKTPYSDFDLAEGWIRDKIKVMDEESRTPGSFEDLAEKIIKSYEVKNNRSTDRLQRSLKNLRLYFGKMEAKDITENEIEDYIRLRTKKVSGKLWDKKPAAAGTIRQELSNLKTMLKLAVRYKMMYQIPVFTMPPPAPAKQGFLDWPEIRLLMQNSPDYLKPVIRFGAFVGWRINTIREFTWSMVDMGKQILYVPAELQKNKSPLAVPFGSAPILEQILTEQWQNLKVVPTTQAQKRETPVFPGANGSDRFGDFRFSWNKACREAGLGYGYKLTADYVSEHRDEFKEGPTYHDFRRTSVRNLVRSGVRETVAMKITGHLTRSIFQRYDITSEDDLANALGAVNDYSTQGINGKAQKRVGN